MWRLASVLARRTSSSQTHLRSRISCINCESKQQQEHFFVILRYISNLASKPSLSIWRRKKDIGKEGLVMAKELKRLQSDPIRLDRFIKSQVSRLLKSDLVSVLAEFQRQNQVFLCMKLYDVVRKEIWYRPDMFFYRDMLMMLARNKKIDEAKLVWQDLKKEGVLFDQHTFGDIMRAFLDNGLPSEAMDIYEEMRQSPDLPLSLPFRVILKGLIPYPDLREKVKDDFIELFPNMIVYDPAEDLFEDQGEESEAEDDYR
ncbi:pentatricopeptide repeat-containing protein At1g62350 [Euphorbia lathyris]|uniref:pentatricopeptide repeat-containing protein At1g62350 n=1 Tax=Euphorbia lathyris TaxID=212925 RepID=UPI003313A168